MKITSYLEIHIENIKHWQEIWVWIINIFHICLSALEKVFLINVFYSNQKKRNNWLVHGNMNMTSWVEQTNWVSNFFPVLFLLYATLYCHREEQYFFCWWAQGIYWHFLWICWSCWIYNCVLFHCIFKDSKWIILNDPSTCTTVPLM